MPLKISLKPNEKIVISGAVITNGGSATNLLIENNVPILREKDILIEAMANSPARRIYFTVQLMYIDRDNLMNYHAAYWRLVRDFVNAAPGSLKIIDAMNEYIIGERYYQALKQARKLIEYEKAITAEMEPVE